MAKPPVYCDPEVLARITPLTLRARRVVDGTVSGLHKSPFHGFSAEFTSYREYAPGDDLRRLDWRVYGRTDRHYIKQYESESNLRAMIVMDASASMRYGSGAMTKFDYGATVAASLATLLVQQQDPVGLALFDDQQRELIAPAATQAQLIQIIGQLETAKPDRRTELGEVIQSLAGRLKRRGMIIIISDLLTDLEEFYEGLSRLLFAGHEIMVLQVLDRDELEMPFDDSVMFQDIEGDERVLAEPWSFRRAYRSAMDEFLDDVATHCGNRGVDHNLLLTDEDLGLALSHYLHAREQFWHQGAAPRR